METEAIMAKTYDSQLSKKLNLTSGMETLVLGKPGDVGLDGLATTDAADADGILLFVRTLADVDANGARLLAAAKADRIAWLAYPKGRQLATDLNRDILWEHMLRNGLRAVRQVSIDDTWSAIRFRPAIR
jgi:hypothetical protein